MRYQSHSHRDAVVVAAVAAIAVALTALILDASECVCVCVCCPKDVVYVAILYSAFISPHIHTHARVGVFVWARTK